MAFGSWLGWPRVHESGVRRAGQQAGGPGGAEAAVRLKSPGGGIRLPQGTSVCPLQPDEAHPSRRANGFTQSLPMYTLLSFTDTFPVTSKLAFDQISGHGGLGKSTYEINHHSPIEQTRITGIVKEKIKG